MKNILVSLVVGFVVAVLVYSTLPNQMYVEKAFNIIVLSFVGATAVTWLITRSYKAGR